MYPKKSIFTQNSQRQADTRLGKRDQICRLLINKFRQKFNINFHADSFLDQKIVELVGTAIKSDEPIGEKQLVLLSRKVTSTVEEHRKKHKPPTSLASSQ